MDIFEYLPQLIVAYDGNDEFANLIHVKKANKDNNYFCPCCGGNVKPRALDSTKEQSHYYHVTGKCTKESQLHFFCKNWLFDEGSKFYVDNSLFEVKSIEIEKPFETPFGKYIPDVTVHTTTGIDIYFEMFFTNRKTGDDYFCKWDYLGNDVVEVNIKEYMFKTDTDTIPTFTYLFHDGTCYSEPYIKRDLYANTIARIKHELTRQKVLNYKARIEQLDWFWQEIRNNKSREEILNVIDNMEYDDMVSCYEIIKRKQCVSYLKNDVLDLINQKVISEVRDSLELPHDENIYFDLEHVKGRTYKAGIRLNIKTEHITYDKLISTHKYWMSFDSIKGFPKIVFSKNIFNKSEIIISDKDTKELLMVYDDVKKLQKRLLKREDIILSLEKDIYKIRMNNDLYTVLFKTDGKFETLFENKHVDIHDINELINEINKEIDSRENKTFLNNLFDLDEYKSFLSYIKKINDIDICIDIEDYIGRLKNGIRLQLVICGRKFYDNELKRDINDFMEHVQKCKSKIQDFIKTHQIILNIVSQINNCSNNYWEANFLFDHNGYPVISVDQKYFVPKRYTTFERVILNNSLVFVKTDIICELEKAMHQVMKNMERCGYRVLEVRNEE